VKTYKNLINENPSGEELSDRHSGWEARRGKALTGVIYPQMIIFFIGACVYALAMLSYRTIEFEYSSLVRDGGNGTTYKSSSPL